MKRVDSRQNAQAPTSPPQVLTGCVHDLRFRTLFCKTGIMLSATYWSHCDGQMGVHWDHRVGQIRVLNSWTIHNISTQLMLCIVIIRITNYYEDSRCQKSRNFLLTNPFFKKSLKPPEQSIHKRVNGFQAGACLVEGTRGLKLYMIPQKTKRNISRVLQYAQIHYSLDLSKNPK